MPTKRSIRSITHLQLKKAVLDVLKASSNGVMKRSLIASAIRRSFPEDALTRTEQRHFLARVNKAIGALQLEKPATVVPVRGNPEKVRYTKHRKREDGVTREALMLAIRERVVYVSFRCAGCENIIEVTEFRENPQCSNCGTLAVPE